MIPRPPHPDRELTIVKPAGIPVHAAVRADGADGQGDGQKRVRALPLAAKVPGEHGGQQVRKKRRIPFVRGRVEEVQSLRRGCGPIEFP